MEIMLVYALLTSAMFYLASRARITSWLWSRYPAWLASWVDCAACIGTWFGLLVGVIGHLLHFGAGTEPGLLQNGAGLSRILVSEWYSPIVVALCAMVWTPIVAGYMQLGFERLGSGIPVDEGPTDG